MFALVLSKEVKIKGATESRAFHKREINVGHNAESVKGFSGDLFEGF